ncbi:hypothetical protein BC826DRAFT_1060351 [Russula brevipes]|nr:hypothetical protein BC826DRAFT_1060351 [Russula brevipes]
MMPPGLAFYSHLIHQPLKLFWPSTTSIHDPDASSIDGPFHFRGRSVPTPAPLILKNAPSPTVIASQRKGEPEDWSCTHTQWTCAAMARVAEGTVRLPASPTFPCQHRLRRRP